MSIEIQVIQARNLPKADVFGKIDPYFVLTCGSECYRTTTKKNTYSPVYNEHFRFCTINDVLVKLMDEMMGFLRITTSAEYENRRVRKWFLLTNSREENVGQVELEIMYQTGCSFPQQVYIPPMQGLSVPSQGYPPPSQAFPPPPPEWNDQAFKVAPNDNSVGGSRDIEIIRLRDELKQSDVIRNDQQNRYLDIQRELETSRKEREDLSALLGQTEAERDNWKGKTIGMSKKIEQLQNELLSVRKQLSDAQRQALDHKKALMAVNAAHAKVTKEDNALLEAEIASE